MYQVILWDNDGVLVNTEALYFEATRTVFAGIQFELTEALYQDYFLKASYGTWKLLQDFGYDEKLAESLRLERNALYTEFLQTRDLEMAGAAEVLEQLSGQYRMGIVTSSNRSHFDLIHQRTGFLKFFDFVVAQGDFTQSKPDPEPYRVGFSRSGLPPEACLAIEDSERGLQAATGAGLACWVIPTNLSQGSDFSRAAKILTSIRQVPELLNHHHGR